jgi:hypothetical protein
MQRWTCRLWGLVIAMCAIAGCAVSPDGSPHFTLHPPRVLAGDLPGAEVVDTRDDTWREIDLRRLPQRHGVFWIRQRIDVDDRSDPLQPLAVRFSVLGSRDVYWDGELIGRSGVVGTNRDTEVAGPLDRVFAIPTRSATRGPHVLAVRFSNFHYDLNLATYFQGLDLGTYEALVTSPMRTGITMLVPFGAVLIIAIYHGVLFFSFDRRWSYALFTAAAVSMAVLLAAEAWRWVFGYPYTYHVTRLRIEVGAAFFTAVLLPTSILFEFSIPSKARWVGAALCLSTLALMVPDGYDTKRLALSTVAVIVSAVIVIAAARQRREGWEPIACALLPCPLLLYLGSGNAGEVWFSSGFAALAVGMLVTAHTRMREQQRLSRTAALRAARLELQLLKTSIQPHFLMNTLTSIIEWIEVEPAVAARFVEAVAEELQLLARVSSEALIAIELELQLCHAHLAVMSLRHERHFHLRTIGIEPTEVVPPAVFHTLIENGLTHGRFSTNDVEFVLKRCGGAQNREYRLLSPEAIAEPQARVDEGTGLRYVRARLEESWPGRTRVTGGVTALGWETVVQIDDTVASV